MITILNSNIKNCNRNIVFQHFIHDTHKHRTKQNVWNNNARVLYYDVF